MFPHKYRLFVQNCAMNVIEGNDVVDNLDINSC